MPKFTNGFLDDFKKSGDRAYAIFRAGDYTPMWTVYQPLAISADLATCGRSDVNLGTARPRKNVGRKRHRRIDTEKRFRIEEAAVAATGTQSSSGLRSSPIRGLSRAWAESE